MRAPGRPLRFLTAVLGGWTALRAALLMPEAATLPGLIGAMAAPGMGLESLPPRLVDGGWLRQGPILPDRARVNLAATPARQSAGRGGNVHLALLGRIGFGEPEREPRPTLVVPYAPPAMAQAFARAPLIAMPGSPRLSGSAWLALRDGANSSLGPGGQLGGSQGGIRLRYELGSARALALSARLSSPLRGQGREAALGVEWRPRGSPVALLAEQRFGLDDTPGGPTLMAIGGIAPTPIAAGFDLEAYAQGGAVIRGGRAEGFADGAARLSTPVATIGRSELTAGIGAWGGAQRDAQRLDIGPSIAIGLPVGSKNVRLTLDWRQRVAGNARPGSCLALTLGSDF